MILLELADLARGFDTVHDRELDIHLEGKRKGGGVIGLQMGTSITLETRESLTRMRWKPPVRHFSTASSPSLATPYLILRFFMKVDRMV